MHSRHISVDPGLSALSYADAVDSWIGRKIISLSEKMSGRSRYEELYRVWRQDILPSNDRVFGRMLDLIDIDLSISGHWPPVATAEERLVMIANHPYGIGDGIAILALAEQLGRPFKVLINAELLRVPEIRPYSLPIDFRETKEAQRNNLAVRREALDLIRQGVTIVVFPSGAVATAARPWSKAAAEWPWKLFPARLVRDAQASVIPVYFAGQNGRMFQIASHVSLTARMSMLVREFTKLSGHKVDVVVGNRLQWHMLEPLRGRKELTAHLRAKVFELSPVGQRVHSGAVINPLY